LEIFSIKAKFEYDKGDSVWTIEFSVAIKVTIVLPFDLHVKLFFHSKDTINNFGQCMLKPFVTMTITFVVIGVHGEIDGKFELLVIDGTSLEDIQIGVYILLCQVLLLYIILFSTNNLSYL
jgi:hypothetical protein